jgi:hypothetical protein
MAATTHNRRFGRWRQFLQNQAGATAVYFGLSAVPLVGGAGIALDYLRAHMAQQFLQGEVDAAALGAAAGGESADDTDWVATVVKNSNERFGAGLQDIEVDGDWLNERDFAITAIASVPVTFLSVLPGQASDVPVSVRAVARHSDPTLVYKPPVISQLDPDAADYNRIYVYCFDHNEGSNPRSGTRSQMTAIADNAGTYYDYVMPQCGPEEMMSYRLHNVRNARTQPWKWDSPTATHYEHYTDTIMENGAESYSLGGYSLVETVLCNNQNQCKPQAQGGIIPEGPGRTPEHATAGCSAGKFFYYGWEDRPPEQGGSDRDYNDIRIVIECPSVTVEGSEQVVLLE